MKTERMTLNLSSPEKLIEYGNLYFDYDLKYTPRPNIKIINDIAKIKFKNLDNDK